MKIFISVDMEGLAGITNWKQETEEQERFRLAMHTQLQWVVEGIQSSARQKDIDEILIADSHGSGTNLSYFELGKMDDRISLVSGSPRPAYMMSGLDSTFSHAFLVGYHAGVGQSFANMDHSFSSRLIHAMWINGKKMSEAIVNAAYAGTVGVPVSLIIGDSGLQEQLEEWHEMDWVSYVCTKDSLSRTGARFHSMRELRTATRETVKSVLAREPHSYPLYCFGKKPYELTIEFTDSAMASSVAQIPGITLSDARTTHYVSDDFCQIYEMIMYGCKLAKE